jgi:hypothetical protein
MKFDTNGVLLADVPNAGVSRTAAGQRSGNPRHDIHSGKFGAGGGGGGAPGTPAPAGADPVEYARMLDAVREAAREFDNPQEGDIRDFIKGRANSPDQVDIQNFMDMVTEQRKSDLVDLLDQNLRASGPMARGRRKVKLSAPKGYVRRLLRQLDPESLGEVMHRLESMGHDTSSLQTFFGSRVKQDTHQAATEHAATLKPTPVSVPTG